MNILILADVKNKKVNQELMKWAGKTHIKFHLYFTSSKSKIEELSKKHSFIVSYNEEASKILKRNKKKFIEIKNEWKVK